MGDKKLIKLKDLYLNTLKLFGQLEPLYNSSDFVGDKTNPYLK